MNDDQPSWYPGGPEVKPAPMPLLRVQAFLNTRDVEEGTDLLADPAPARDWLIDAGVIGGGTEVTGSRPRARARGSRVSAQPARGRWLRFRAGRRGPGGAAKLTANHAARLTVGDGGALGIEVAGDGDVGDGLFQLLLIIRAAQVDGSWSRLKMCANPDCHWVFYDRSRNQQGNWCDMAVCGNRLKNRQLRARRR